MLNTLVLENRYAFSESESSFNLVSPVVRYSVKQILFIVEKNSITTDNQLNDKFAITYATISEASFLLGSGASVFAPDVILVSSNLENYTDSFLLKTKALATDSAIPFILYSNNYDNIYRNIAVEFGFDDYYTGSLENSFLKKAEFIRKLKVYKNKKTEKDYSVANFDSQSQVRMWPLKRSFDILISGGVLLLLSPFILLIILLIKLESKGPIFYISKRAGNGYKIFNFYKFRSMRQGADKELANLTHMNQYGDAVFFKIQNDPRITRLGRFLRNSSIDEIPQLINVLKGDMSLVGNRPLPLYEAEKLTKDQIAWRFLAPAGITGLWQITKRGRTNMSERERIELDMEYAMNNSFFYDIKILLNTIPVLLQKAEV